MYNLNRLISVLVSVIFLVSCNGGNSTANKMATTNSVYQEKLLVKKVPKLRLISSESGYLPIEIKNATKIVPEDKIYLIAIAKTDESTPKQCLINFSTGECNVVTDHTDLSKFENTTLANLEKDSNGNALFHVKHVQSGRIYFSINHPLSLYFDKITNTIPDPDGFKTRDANYYTLYDKVEFSFVNAGVWFNPTAVDFFSLPIEITDNSSVTVKSAGLVDSRANIFDKAHKIFKDFDTTSNHEWSKLFLTYDHDNIRLMSPGKAMIETPGQEYNPFANNPFSHNYLTDSSKFGFDYLDEVWKYYATNEIKILAKELEGQKDDDGKTLPVACDSGGAYSFKDQADYLFTGKVNSEGKFVFKNNGGCEVILSKPQSISLFAGAVGAFDAPNNTPKAIIVRELTSAFDVGLLPAPSGTILSLPKNIDSPTESGKYIPNMDNYFIKNLHEGHYYSNNSLLNAGNTGPWYDLYSKALHAYGHEHPIYTFAYDDALGQDGTIHEGNGSNPGKVTIILHDLTGTVVPDVFAKKHGFDVFITVPEALYIFKTFEHAPSSLSDFAGSDLIFDKANVALYQVTEGKIAKITLSTDQQQKLAVIATMPSSGPDDAAGKYNGAMKKFLLGSQEYLATQGLALNKISVVLENGPNGEEKLHDATLGANHIINATSPLKVKINSMAATIYLDPYVIEPNNPVFDGIVLARMPEQDAKSVMVTLPGSKPKN